jgi:hypothetical protein
MNERIRELYKNVLASSENMRWNIEDAEKFAELIVKECADIATNRYQRLMDGGKAIKHHFGVE